MSHVPPQVFDYLARAAQDRGPRHLLLIAPRAAADPIHAALPADTRCTHIESSEAFVQATVETRFDLAIVLDTVEHMDNARARALIGYLRDVAAQSVLITVSDSIDDSERWRISDFIALGFRRAPHSRDLPRGWSVYRYDIHDYKTTPDWLNSRYWANPDRWDKQRW